MKLFRIPYRWTWRTLWRNIHWIITDITGGISNVFRWAPVIWFDADFDWAYLARVMEYKLRRSANLELTIGHHVGSKRDGRRMLVCADLLRRLQEDNYAENAEKRFGRCARAFKVSIQQSKDDQEYLGKMIGRYLTEWWD